MFGLITAVFPDFSAGPSLPADTLKMKFVYSRRIYWCQQVPEHVSGYYRYSTEQNKNRKPCTAYVLVILLTGDIDN